MLCQLSYRGSLGRKSLAKLAFDLLQRVPDPGEDSLQLDRPGQVLARQLGELAPDEPLLEAQDELAGDVLVEPLVGDGRVELRPEPDQLLVGLALAGEVGAQAAVERVVEVAVVETAQIALRQVGPGGADGEEVALEAVAGPEQLSPRLPDDDVALPAGDPQRTPGAGRTRTGRPRPLGPGRRLVDQALDALERLLLRRARSISSSTRWRR